MLFAGHAGVGNQVVCLGRVGGIVVDGIAGAAEIAFVHRNQTLHRTRIERANIVADPFCVVLGADLGGEIAVVFLCHTTRTRRRRRCYRIGGFNRCGGYRYTLRHEASQGETDNGG